MTLDSQKHHQKSASVRFGRAASKKSLGAYLTPLNVLDKMSNADRRARQEKFLQLKDPSK